ncbi:MAG TPA: TerC family protein [Polyangiaceae bacterium]|nr:TerC family protein [Polyangiaceae bacterium]
MDWSALLTLDGLLSLFTLAAMEIVLGIDNVVFLSIITARLPAAQQPSARRIGLALALGARLGLLFGISWVMGLTAPLFAVLGKSFSGRDLILLCGGGFLIAKATHEIHGKVESGDKGATQPVARAGYGMALLQITALDLIFSLDSVITAVGMVDNLSVMVVAMVIAVLVMLAFAAPVSNFVERHPTMKMLALSFLILIGVMLVVDGTGHHIPKGYIYFAMAFSLGVELLNLRVRKAPTSA